MPTHIYTLTDIMKRKKKKRKEKKKQKKKKKTRLEKLFLNTGRSKGITRKPAKMTMFCCVCKTGLLTTSKRA